jgi:hypothetical protein
MVEAVIRAKFRKGRGSKFVRRGQWQLLDPRNTRQRITSDSWEFIPGMKIIMAMILSQIDEMMRCPRPGCPLVTYREVSGGGRNW